MKTLLIITSLLATTAITQAQQYLAPGPQGTRYYNYADPGPYYRSVSPGPYYRGGPGPEIGNAIGAVIGTVMQNAVRPRYVPPPFSRTSQSAQASRGNDRRGLATTHRPRTVMPKTIPSKNRSACRPDWCIFLHLSGDKSCLHDT
jgi:hypothetical protein